MKRYAAIALPLVFYFTSSAGGGERRVPEIDDLLKIRSVTSVRLSPDSSRVAYRVVETDFEQNAYVGQLWLHDIKSGRASQLTRSQKSAANPRWSPDGAWLAFTRDHEGKNQIFLIPADGGEAVRVSHFPSGVSEFSWSPDGHRIAFVGQVPESDYRRRRKEHLGDYRVVRKDYRHSHLWVLPVEEAKAQPHKGRRLTRGADFHVLDFAWAPDSQRIAFSATEDPDLVHRHTADIYVLDLTNFDVEKIVSMPGPDRNPLWSPDGSQIVFSSAMGQRVYYPGVSRLATVSALGGEPKALTDAFDESPFPVDWTAEGIYFSALQRVSSHLYRINLDSGAIDRITRPDSLMARGFSLSQDGRKLVYTANSPTQLREVFVSDLDPFSAHQLTSMSAQVGPFILGTRELITWTSQDGTLIEGVLIKPADFDSSRKYPLLCVIHGGPAGIDRPGLLERGTRYYPVDLWVGRGALVLRVNYRGSAGYGEAFRRLNVRNLGVGDAWDVVSGVDHLIDRGWVDPSRVGCMGWSQGGYISAFLTTASDRFAAISVGAGISNWATYYYNTDITPFTIHYLGDNPVNDPEIYRKTSPMSYVNKAGTPTLIQHGELDRRVPIPNAYELRQGLEDRGVPVEMIVYKGFGHGINKPRSMRAVMEHNLVWFNHYLWADPLPDLTRPRLPPAARKPNGGNR